MLEGILEKILQSIFGEYIENLDKENLRIGVFVLYYYLRYGLDIWN